MSGNATQRYANATVLSVCGVDAPHVVTSVELDERLAATYRRVGLRPGLLESLAGITERRWWPATWASPTPRPWPGRRRSPRRGSTPHGSGCSSTAR